MINSIIGKFWNAYQNGEEAPYRKFGNTDSLQLGATLEGLAITRPEPAPATFAPSGPILFRMPCKAIGVSEAMYRASASWPGSPS